MNVGNFGGTLYYNDTQLCDFKFINGEFSLENLVVYDTTLSYLPFPLRSYEDTVGWKSFILSRLIPEWRYEISQDLLSKSPLQEYNEEQLLRFTKARVMTDNYWVREDYDLRCWSAEQIHLLLEDDKLFQ